MSKPLLYFFFILTSFSVQGQTIESKLRFEKGQLFELHVDLKTTVTQQAMGNAISFLADGAALYTYNITETGNNNTSLHHEPKSILFNFDGMGQKRSFNSANAEDMAGQFGDPIKKTLEKKFDMVIDENGKVLRTIPDKMEPVNADERLTIVLNMIKDLSDAVYPPQKGTASFFQVLPAKPVTLGETWTDSVQTGTGNSKTSYTLTGLTDTTLLIDFLSNAATVTKSLMMGRETTTTLNSTSSGKIILDRTTGIIKEKTTTTESNGTVEAMGVSTPVTSKTTLVVHVKPG